jgi:serine/threonine-protein kinase
MSNGNGGYGEYDAGAGEESWTSDPVGRMVGEKYRIVGRIGGGGVADVFEAVHVEIGQRVAIKVLKREYARLDEVSGRFLTEARAAGTIGHPGIVRIHDIGSFESGRPYLVMERLVGPTLADVLDERGRLPREEAVGICVQLLDALEAAHRAGVIHRDLKPENVVLVEGPGGDRWAKIIDFGIARLTREGAAAKRLTMQGSVVGTPYYLSPEQARGSPNLDGRVDVYAAGVMLHEMLTGTLPFEGASVEEILTRVLSAPFPDPRALLPDLPEGLEAAIRRATARRRDDRFASARAFAEALRPFRAETVSVRILAPEEEAELLASLPPRPPRMRSLTPPPCARPEAHAGLDRGGRGRGRRAGCGADRALARRLAADHAGRRRRGTNPPGGRRRHRFGDARDVLAADLDTGGRGPGGRRSERRAGPGRRARAAGREGVGTGDDPRHGDDHGRRLPRRRRADAGRRADRTGVRTGGIRCDAHARSGRPGASPVRPRLPGRPGCHDRGVARARAVRPPGGLASTSSRPRPRATVRGSGSGRGVPGQSVRSAVDRRS